VTAVWQTLLFSAVWIALCATALAAESCLILQQPPPAPHILLFVFAATCCHYNLHYLFRTPDPSRSARDRWLARHRRWVRVLAVVAGLFAVALLARFTPEELLTVAVAAVVSAAYSLPLLPRGWRLRDLGLYKPFILALVWAIVTVWLPAHTSDAYLLTLVLLRRFVFMATLCLAFDVRDIEKDRAQDIRTLPVRRGIPYTHRLIDFLLLLFVVLAVLVEAELRRPVVALALTVSAACTAAVIRLTTRQTSEEYYLGVVDGMMLLQAGLVALAVQ